jgi:four helix bundle protein
MKRNHRELKVWLEAMTLVEMVYRQTASFPSTEQFGLTAQMRRSSVSVPSNIAEGFARTGTRELLHFLSLSAGSLSELYTQAELCVRLGYLKSAAEINAQIDRVSGLLMGLAASLKRGSAK